MAVNKDSNSYTFIFAIILVAVVGTSLASLSVGLKPRQDKNVEVKKKMDILAAIKVVTTRKNVIFSYSSYKESATLSYVEGICFSLNEAFCFIEYKFLIVLSFSLIKTS